MSHGPPEVPIHLVPPLGGLLSTRGGHGKGLQPCFTIREDLTDRPRRAATRRDVPRRAATRRDAPRRAAVCRGVVQRGPCRHSELLPYQSGPSYLKCPLVHFRENSELLRSKALSLASAGLLPCEPYPEAQSAAPPCAPLPLTRALRATPVARRPHGGRYCGLWCRCV